MFGRLQKRKGNWRISILLIAGSVSICLCLGELLLRVGGVHYPLLTVYDEFRGAAHRANAHGLYGGEGRVYIRINSDGLRDREHTRAKPAGTYRVVVLGDSCAEAVQVPLEKTFWAVLEQKLRHSGKLGTQEVEVINFGVSGYGTAQELITLRRHAWDYQPDLVLLAIMTGNDIRNNSRALDGASFRPYFVYQGNHLILDDSFRDSFGFRFRRSWIANAWYDLVDYSRIFQLINEAKSRWIALRQQKVAENTTTLGGGSDGGRWSEPGLDDLIYAPPQSRDWVEAWQVTEGLLLLMHSEVKAKGADFLVVTLSNGVQVHPDPKIRAQFMQSLGVHDLSYPDRRIRELCEGDGIPVINLAEPLLAYAEQKQVYLHGFEGGLGYGHWNQTGHRVAGEQIFQRILELKLVPSTTTSTENAFRAKH